MGQKKLIRFEAIRQFANVLEYPAGMPGQWGAFFKNDHPISLELACGKGEYAVGLGRLYKNQNFLGVDLKGNRIWKGAKTALDEGLDNVGFLRTEIEKITDYFAAGEVSEIWITFPDPQLRFSKMKKRLTHPRFLRLYRQILKAGGTVNLKTDSPDLYRFTKAVINFYGLALLQDLDNVYQSPGLSAELQIKTHYEGLDIAGTNTIHYLQFRLTGGLPAELDEPFKNMMREQNAD
ncbi:MAG TPA: tRNA (guanosine(46)-N7)-methyltransferase TrmB [Panacibacter sp.]|nr:tRNA (guanosine(46)-N7)-methyltransferase TrmB [Panacibacter sp.]HNP46856.1 tRNA (guanosine(46)-N7)-methyltransferase TrmB [Panacibacter sp.]